MKWNGTITVIIPVHNEAAVIEDVVRDIHDKVVGRMPGTRFIVAEDGSDDGTREILKELNREIPFKLISGEERKGYAGAFRDALRLVETELVFFCDSDGQHDPADFFDLYREIEGNDIISGRKTPRLDPVNRVFLSRAYNLLVRLLFGLEMRDIDSGFKVIRKSVIDRVLDDVNDFEYCVMSEFVLKAHLEGFRIREVAVSHHARRSGTSTIFTPAKLPFIMASLAGSLLEMRFRRPGRRG